MPPRRRFSWGPPQDLGRDPSAEASHEARAFRSVELVRRAHEPGGPQRVHVDRKLADGLGRIDVEGHAALPQGGADGRQVLYDTGLVVGEDDRNDRSVIAQCRDDVRGVQQSVAVDGEPRGLHAFCLERGERFVDRGVFDRRRHHMATQVVPAEGGAQHGVVRLGRAPGKDEIAGGAAQQRGHLLARLLQQSARVRPFSVGARRVAVVIAQDLGHGIDDLAANRRGGVVVEIDAHRPSRLRTGPRRVNAAPFPRAAGLQPERQSDQRPCGSAAGSTARRSTGEAGGIVAGFRTRGTQVLDQVPQVPGLAHQAGVVIDLAQHRCDLPRDVGCGQVRVPWAAQREKDVGHPDLLHGTRDLHAPGRIAGGPQDLGVLERAKHVPHRT